LYCKRFSFSQKKFCELYNVWDIESTPRKVEVVTTRLFFFKLHFIPNEVTLFSTIAKLLYRYRCGDRNV